MITVLSGGTGGAKFVEGLYRVLPPGELTVIVNTGDDLRWWGLHVSPDLDSITYALGGVLSRERGWGVEGDSFNCLQSMRKLGAPAWFNLGDRDLALHLTRSQLLAAGKTLAQATAQIAAAFGIEAQILPMTNAPVETRIATADGELGFQEYFVRERCQVPVRGVRFAGAVQAAPAPGVRQAILQSEAVLLAPSNPITSIGPILAVSGIREALRQTRARVAAVSPIVGGAAVSGPAGTLMAAHGLAVSAAAVAGLYRDFLDLLVIDERDAGAAADLRRSGTDFRRAQTIMKSLDDKLQLARVVLAVVARLERRRASA